MLRLGLTLVFFSTQSLVLGSWMDMFGARKPQQTTKIPAPTTPSIPVDLVNNTEDRIMTPHNFSFILNNPDLCNNSPNPVHTLVVIHSHPGNWKRRMSIRRNWPFAGIYPSKVEPDKRRVIVAVFVMGRTQHDSVPKLDADLQDRLAFEHSEFGDIVQEDFVDAYTNLTFKNQLWMRFASQFCRQAKFVLKSDDDMHINMIALLDYLDYLDEEAHQKNATVGLGKKLWCCRWIGMPVLRDKTSKWNVPSSMFKGDSFPAYCSGSAYIVTSEGAAAMYEASKRIPFFWVDDVWATGLVPPKAGVPLIHINQIYIFGGGQSWEERFYSYMDKRTFNFHIFGHFPEKPEHLYSLWNGILVSAGFRSVHLLPPWTWYEPGTSFRKEFYHL